MKRFLCGLVTAGAVCAHLFGAGVARADFTIMPLGDSITYGIGGTSGYRERLYTDLHDAGYAFTFVGTSTESPSRLLTQVGQTHHEGHPGYRIDQIANNLDGNDRSGNNFSNNNGGFWFHKPTPPDIVLLHIGTNDILQNFRTSTMAQRLDQVIGQIVADSPRSLLFVSSIIPLVDANENKLVQAYNTQVRDVIVPKYESLGDNVFFVDQYPNFVDANGNVLARLLPDGIHPNQTGYNLMGDTWAAAIQQAAPVPEPSTVLLAATGTLGVLGWAWWRRRLA